MLLSIIVPVYNTEATLSRCLDSVIPQCNATCELIIVDDGSTDSSGTICDKYGEQNGFIHVVHQQNGGLSDARNKGIDMATGEYLTFIDSDDTIENGTLARLTGILTSHPEYDILEYPVFMYYGSRHQQILHFDDKVYSDLLDGYWLANRAYKHTYACNKVYKRHLFETIKFPKGRKFEDAYTLPLLLRKCHIVATTSQGMYDYYLNPSGITNTASPSSLYQLLESHVSTFQSIRYIAKSRIALMGYYMQIVNIQIDLFTYSHGKLLLPSIRPGFLFTFSKRLTLSMRFKSAILNLFGLKMLCKTMIICQKITRHH